MATIAVGDIHGNRPALVELLAKVQPEVGAGDTVVFLGDYIDRGPDSKGCVDTILGFRRETQAEVVCLLGNHEDWFLSAATDYCRHSWLLGMEGFDTIRSYSESAARTVREAMVALGPALYLERHPLPYDEFFRCVPDEHMKFFKSLRLSHRTADCVCTHGGIDPQVSEVENQVRDALIWGAGSFPDGYGGAEIIVYGHHNNAIVTADGVSVPAVIGRTIGIDSIAQGVLTAIRLPDSTLFQSARHDASLPTKTAG